MGLVKEIMGPSLMGRSSFPPSSRTLYFSNNHNMSRLSLGPVVVPLMGNKSVLLKKKFVPAVAAAAGAATAEDLVRAAVAEEERVKIKVRAVVSVRNKKKVDLKECLMKEIDALGDKIGRNVVLQLVSTNIDFS